MRKRELKLVVTFHTTADAMAMEKACGEHQVPGRLIPVPRPEARSQVLEVMAEKGIEQEELHECMV